MKSCFYFDLRDSKTYFEGGGRGNNIKRRELYSFEDILPNIDTLPTTKRYTIFRIIMLNFKVIFMSFNSLKTHFIAPDVVLSESFDSCTVVFK